jgi:hypothetical protein
LPQLVGKERDEIYEAFIEWLEGRDVEYMKKRLGV